MFDMTDVPKFSAKAMVAAEKSAEMKEGLKPLGLVLALLLAGAGVGTMEEGSFFLGSCIAAVGIALLFFCGSERSTDDD